MPKFTDATEMDTHPIGGTTFQFSAAKIENLGASEYTLVVIAVDCSGSVHPFKADMEKALQEVVGACRKSPRADNLLLRVVLFDTHAQEFHGFKPLPDCNEADYKGCLFDGGMTALYDAAYTGIKSATDFGKQLIAKQFQANAAIFVITDGQDNASTVSRKMVADVLTEARSSEALESIMPVLIGVNAKQGGLDSYLEDFKNEAGFQQYVGIATADQKTLAKLGGFISRSISSQSQSLGTNGASKSLHF